MEYFQYKWEFIINNSCLAATDKYSEIEILLKEFTFDIDYISKLKDFTIYAKSKEKFKIGQDRQTELPLMVCKMLLFRVI